MLKAKTGSISSPGLRCRSSNPLDARQPYSSDLCTEKFFLARYCTADGMDKMEQQPEKLYLFQLFSRNMHANPSNCEISRSKLNREGKLLVWGEMCEKCLFPGSLTLHETRTHARAPRHFHMDWLGLFARGTATETQPSCQAVIHVMNINCQTRFFYDFVSNVLSEADVYTATIYYN